jgi:hypothetical protein
MASATALTRMAVSRVLRQRHFREKKLCANVTDF